MTCIHCGGRAMYGEVDGRRIAVCLACGKDAEQQQQPKPHRPDLLERVNEQAERDVVAQIVAWVEAHGGTVFQYGQRDARRSGSTRGAPDLMVRLPHMPPRMFLAVEAKAANGTLSKAQRDFHAAGLTIVAHSLAEFVEAIA